MKSKIINKKPKNIIFPNNWKKITIREICSVRRGASPRPIQKFLESQGIPWVKISDATKQKTPFIEWTKEFISEKGRSHTVIVEPGDLILSNSATPGLPKFLKINAAIHDGWLLLRNFNGVDKMFLYYFLINERPNLVGIADGTVFKNLKTDMILDYTIFLPSLFVQEKIGKILFDLDNKIENLQNQNKVLEQIIQSIFKSWFVDFDGITKFEDSELGQIPKGWTVGTIGELAHVTSGKRPNYVSENNDSEFKIPLYGASGIMGYVNELLYEHRIILTGRVGTIGKIQYVYGECFPSDNTLVILPKDQQYFNFVYSFLLNNDFKSIMGGSTQPLITQTDLKNTLCIISKDRIIQFEIITGILFDKYFKNKLIIKNLKDLLDSLLPKLMSGEIRV